MQVVWYQDGSGSALASVDALGLGAGVVTTPTQTVFGTSTQFTLVDKSGVAASLREQVVSSQVRRPKPDSLSLACSMRVFTPAAPICTVQATTQANTLLSQDIQDFCFVGSGFVRAPFFVRAVALHLLISLVLCPAVL